MNEEMQKQLMEKADVILDGLIGAAKTTADVAAEQLPLLAQEYLRFAMVWETTLWLAGIAGVCITIHIANKIVKAIEDPAPWIIAGIPLTAIGVPTVMQTREVILVWFAPKIYLLENIARLLK